MMVARYRVGFNLRGQEPESDPLWFSDPHSATNTLRDELYWASQDDENDPFLADSFFKAAAEVANFTMVSGRGRVVWAVGEWDYWIEEIPPPGSYRTSTGGVGEL